MDGRLIIANQRLETGELKESLNPATLESLGVFHLASSAECRQAVEAAQAAFPVWRDMPLSEKRRIFLTAKQVLLERADEVARTISQEKGGPLTEVWATEVFPVLEALDYYAKKAHKHLRHRRSRPHIFLLTHKHAEFRFQALGPTLIISPWNYPFLIPGFDLLSALTSGNTVILRPSSSTAFTGLLLGEILNQAGLPPGVLNVVPCNAQHAESLITSPLIKSIMFTGSSGVGKRIMAMASQNLTNVILELGGKDPMIVCADADMERAARGAVWGAFSNCGQSCCSVERIYVEQCVAQRFTDMVLDLTRSLELGDPLSPDTDLGPLTTSAQRSIVEEHIQEAVRNGARLLCGGERVPDLPGYFLKPAVLTNIDHSMRLMKEETFGPVLPIMPFDTLEEAAALANDSEFGLTASAWTRSRKTAEFLMNGLEAGTVSINDHMSSFPEPNAIWGGVKQTGIGRSHGPYGLLELANVKYTSSDFARKRTLLWWFPYSRRTQELLARAAVLYHDTRLRRQIRALGGLVPQLREIGRKVPLRNFVKSLPRILSK
jgi:acyl-CoA reductase-like NAD-dependent aldehyde dehydrogenase